MRFTIDLDSDTVVAKLNEVVSEPISVDSGVGGLTDFWVRGAGDVLILSGGVLSPGNAASNAAATSNAAAEMAVPEPATQLRMALALGFGCLRRRRGHVDWV